MCQLTLAVSSFFWICGRGQWIVGWVGQQHQYPQCPGLPRMPCARKTSKNEPTKIQNETINPSLKAATRNSNLCTVLRLLKKEQPCTFSNITSTLTHTIPPFSPHNTPFKPPFEGRDENSYSLEALLLTHMLWAWQLYEKKRDAVENIQAFHKSVQYLGFSI